MVMINFFKLYYILSELSITHFISLKTIIYRYLKKADLCQILIKRIPKKRYSMYISPNDEHTIGLDELIYRLGSDLQNGLSKNTADDKMNQFGRNVISERKTIPGYLRLLIEYTSQFGGSLFLASILCFVAYGLTPTYRLDLLNKYVPHSLTDSSNLGLGIVLFFLNFIIGTFTYFQNKKSEALTKIQLQAYQYFIPSQTVVVRDGCYQKIISSQLVPGDIVNIETGDAIPADVRIIASEDLKVDESNLTGTSFSVIKSITCTSQNPLETKNMAHFGTFCKEGSGRGVVVNTGDRTILGRLNQRDDLSFEIQGQEYSVYIARIIAILFPQSGLRFEQDRLVIIIKRFAIITMIILLIIAFGVGYDVSTVFIFSVGIIVSLVPEALLATVAIAMTVSIKKLAGHKIFVQNLQIIDTLGMITCLVVEKNTLTQNKMTVEHLWYDDHKVRGNLKNNHQDKSFKALQECAIICSEATFDLQLPQDQIMWIENNPNFFYTQVQKQEKLDAARIEQNIKLSKIKWQDRSTIGDAAESALIRFYQPIHDILLTRGQCKVVQDYDGQPCIKPFNSSDKYDYRIVEYETPDSHYCLFMKGMSERIWCHCESVLFQGEIVPKSQVWEENFKGIIQQLNKEGERNLGLSKCHLPKKEFPLGFKFSLGPQNFPLDKQTFVGIISLIDPPKDSVSIAVERCQNAGIKVIMATGDMITAAGSTAKKCGIIWDETANDLAEEQGITFEEACKISNSVIIHGDLLTKMEKEDEDKPEELKGLQLKQWLSKSQVVFARTSPAQKIIIIEACQKMGHIVAGIGYNVTQIQQMSKADIKISINVSQRTIITGQEDIILFEDDFECIVNGIQESRRLFDNLKKVTAFTMISNISQVWPFIATILIRFPLPLTTILILILEFCINFAPTIALIYEEAENDVMLRNPRRKAEHLLSTKLIIFGYLQFGTIQAATGFLQWFIILNDFGIPAGEVTMLTAKKGVIPYTTDFYDPKSPWLGNSNLQANYLQNGGSCFPDNANYQTVDWLYRVHDYIDLRQMIVYCGKDGNYHENVNWGPCHVNQISPMTGRPVCYSTELNKYGQSGFFFALVINQYSAYFVVQTLKLSIIQQGIKNYIIYFGFFVSFGILACLAYFEPFYYAFGSRDLIFQHYGICAIPLGITMLIWSEIRKFMIRNKKAPHPRMQNWWERCVCQ